MAPAARLALSFYKGEDYAAEGTHIAGPLRAPVNITGWTIVCTVRARATDPDPPLLSVMATVVDGPAGTYMIPFSHAQLLALGVGDFHCDVWRQDPGSETEMAVGMLSGVQGVRYP